MKRNHIKYSFASVIPPTHKKKKKYSYNKLRENVIKILSSGEAACVEAAVATCLLYKTGRDAAAKTQR